MGVPPGNVKSSENDAPAAAQAQNTHADQTNTTATQPPDAASSSQESARNLPPEALDLASKLFDYAREGKTGALGQYLQAGIPANLTNSSGQTLLMLAAYYNHAETVSMLIRRGADPNSLNDQGQSPLAGAVFKDYEDVVRVLVDEGKADPHAGQPDAYECVGMFKREKIARVLGIELPEGGGQGGVEGAQEAANIGRAYALRNGGTMGGAMS